jgi:hypothetical protein
MMKDNPVDPKLIAEIDKLGDEIDRRLPHGMCFALAVFDPRSKCFLVHIASDVEPSQMREFLMEAARTMKEPEQIVGGN